MPWYVLASIIVVPGAVFRCFTAPREQRSTVVRHSVCWVVVGYVVLWAFERLLAWAPSQEFPVSMLPGAVVVLWFLGFVLWCVRQLVFGSPGSLAARVFGIMGRLRSHRKSGGVSGCSP